MTKDSSDLNGIIYRKEKTITPGDILFDYKLPYVDKFRNAKLAESDSSKKVICKKIGISQSTLQRNMKAVGFTDEGFYGKRLGKKKKDHKKVDGKKDGGKKQERIKVKGGKVESSADDSQLQNE